MRARFPDVESTVECDGLRLGYEVYENAGPTVLLLPTWTIVHCRHWKMQIPYLARHYRVVTFDGPGNGLSDRSTLSKHYSADAYAEYALAVMTATGTDVAVVVGLSLGAAYATRLARMAPDRVAGVVMIGPSIPLTPPAPERAHIEESFTKPYPEGVSGWGKYNIAYWHDHYEDFTRFFFGQCLIESHSTKQIEDTVGWAAETTPEVLEADAFAPPPEEDWVTAVGSIECPVLVVHGTQDSISRHERGVEAARLSGGNLLSLEGSGHLSHARDPVAVNLAIRGFVDRLAR